MVRLNVFDGDVYDSILYSPNYRIIEEKINRTFNLFGSDLFCVEFRLCLLNFLSLVSLFVSQENSIFQIVGPILIDIESDGGDMDTNCVLEFDEWWIWKFWDNLGLDYWNCVQKLTIFVRSRLGLLQLFCTKFVYCLVNLFFDFQVLI